MSLVKAVLPSTANRYRRCPPTCVAKRPEIMIVACCAVDSRSAPETILIAAPGELFVHRNVVNLIPPHDPDGHQHGTSAAIERLPSPAARKAPGGMGYSCCGGINAFLTDGQLDGIDFIGPWIGPLRPAAELIADETPPKVRASGRSNSRRSAG